jgi:hypothetical protein
LLLPGGDVTQLKLGDFGIAKVTGDPRRLTYTGVLLGTLGYVAPEQLRGETDADARADVFALGCVLYECLTGRAAFVGANPMAVLAKIVLQGSPSLRAARPDLPAALDDLLQRMLAKDPADRPGDAAQVADELEAFDRFDLREDDEAASLPRPAAPSRPSFSPVSLGMSERRLVSIVLAGDELDAADRTLLAAAEPAPEPDLASIVAEHGGRIELLAGRSLVVTIWSHGETADRADRAALLALALQRENHSLPVCIVTGRGLSASPKVGGDLIDLGAAILRATPRGVVRLDEATAGALGPRFLVSRNAEGQLVLEGASEEGASSGRPTRFAGRERELAMLEGMIEGCASEPQAGAVLVLGPSGAGKSRLMDELRARLGGASLGPRQARTIFHLGRADVALSGKPHGVLADAIRRGAGLRRGEGMAARRAKLLDRMGDRVPMAAASKAAAVLAELTGRAPAAHAAGTPTVDPAAAVDATREAMETFLTAECKLAPVLFALEDAQWADAASLTLLASVLRSLRDLPFVVVAIARPELLERFPGLWCERDVQVIRLGPLSRRACEGIVKEALGARGTDAVVEQVIERAGGNPFYLRELVRAVLDGCGDALPASVLDAVEARLSAEGSEARRMLRAASIFGRRFSRDGIAALTGVGAAQASACLERLEARELIAPASSPGRTGDSDYVFRHALVLEAAYATLTDDDRTLGHQLALAWLAQGEGQAAAPSSNCTPR